LIGLVAEIVKLGFNDSCIICNRVFTDEDFRAGDVEAVVTEPPFPFGRTVKTGRIIDDREETKLRLFHKGTAYHESCYYKRKYRLDN